MASPDPEKIARLRQALTEAEEGRGPAPLFDKEAEESKAKVRERALRLLDQRARSRFELEKRLIDADFPESLVVAVVDELVDVNLVDDARFASEWVRQRHQRRGKSTRVLDLELKRKGVGEEDRREAISQIDQDDEESIARKLAAKKARSVKAVPADRAERQKALRRIVGVLARRGFPEGMAMRISIEALDAHCEELSHEDDGADQ